MNRRHPPDPGPANPGSATEHLAALVVCFVVSAWGLFQVGSLGFHFEDLSIPWDGGYRVYSGQLPFVDFFAPIGPVLFLQQALFFRLFGVGLVGFLAHAAFLNGVAGWVVWTLLRPWGRAPAVAGGAITLAWFFLPPGAPYIDTTAFFWVLLALRCGITGRSVATGGWRLPLAGACAGLAFLTKQNIGALGGAGLGLLLLLQARRLRPVLAYSAGVALSLGAFFVYLRAVGGWESHLTYFWQVPLESGRLKYLLPWVARGVVKVLRPELVQSSFGELLGPAVRELGVYLTCFWLARRALLGREPARRRWLPLGAIFLLLLQQWSFNTSNNDEALYWPFLGLLLGLLAVELGVSDLPARRSAALFLGLGLGALLWGWHLASSRVIHSLETDQLVTRLEHPRLRGLWLRSPEGEDLAAALEFLDERRAAGERFCVLGHPTLLHGAVGSPSPQPLLWFRAGVSYSATDPSATDDTLVAALQRARVRWIVLGPRAADEILVDFPGVVRYLEERYRPSEELTGAYRAFRRRD